MFKKVLYVVFQIVGVIGTAGAFLMELDLKHEKDEDKDSDEKK